MIINFKFGIITGIIFLIIFIPLIQLKEKNVLNNLIKINEGEKVLLKVSKLLSLNLIFIFLTGFLFGTSIILDLYFILIGASVNPSSYPGLIFLIFMNLCLIAVVLFGSFTSLVITNYRILQISSLKHINKFIFKRFEIYLNNINYFKYFSGGILSKILIKTKDKKGFRLTGYGKLSEVNELVLDLIKGE